MSFECRYCESGGRRGHENGCPVARILVLEQALRDILDHQKVVAGTMQEYSTVTHIARRALEPKAHESEGV